MGQTYWVESGELWTANDAQITWKGQPDGKPVAEVIALPGTDDAIVVLDWMAGPRSAARVTLGWPNLVRVRPDGSVVWRADALDSLDVWVGVQWSDGILKASTWRSYLVRLDPDSGTTMSQEFTK